MFFGTNSVNTRLPEKYSYSFDAEFKALSLWILAIFNCQSTTLPLLNKKSRNWTPKRGGIVLEWTKSYESEIDLESGASTTEIALLRRNSLEVHRNWIWNRVLLHLKEDKKLTYMQVSTEVQLWRGSSKNASTFNTGFVMAFGLSRGSHILAHIDQTAPKWVYSTWTGNRFFL